MDKSYATIFIVAFTLFMIVWLIIFRNPADKKKPNELFWEIAMIAVGWSAYHYFVHGYS